MAKMAKISNFAMTKNRQFFFCTRSNVKASLVQSSVGDHMFFINIQHKFGQ
jgi:hypothetical protein